LENPQSLGEHLKRARQLKGIHQKDAATLLGICHFTYMTWEKDQKRPFPRYYPAIIKWLGYNPLPEGTNKGQQMQRDRLTRGLTQEQAAKVAGIDESTWCKREHSEKGS
jgi:DNA-binding XRE family transcriptional regulator